MKRRVVFFLLPALVALATGGCTLHDESDENIVLLVAFDGFRWDYPDLYHTPNLESMERGGVRAMRLFPSFPSKTFPNMYTLATGLHPDNHGIIDNTFYSPELDYLYRMGDRNAVENGDFYSGEPIWVTASQQGLITGSFFWVGSEAPIGGRHPDYWKRFDSSVPFIERIDTVVKWLGYPPDKRPNLITLYYEEPDMTGHNYGPVSEQTGEVVREIDSLIGLLREKIALLPVAGSINLIVLSDHGMAEISPDRYIDLTTVIPRDSMIAVYGGNPVYNINVSEYYIDEAVAAIRAREGISGWHRDSLPEQLNYGSNYRVQPLVVVADSSWSVGLRRYAGSYRGGAHGWDPANGDMHSIFYAEGPAFKRGAVVDTLYNVDI